MNARNLPALGEVPFTGRGVGASEDQEGTDVKSVPSHSNGFSIILGLR